MTVRPRSSPQATESQQGVAPGAAAAGQGGAQRYEQELQRGLRAGLVMDCVAAIFPDVRSINEKLGDGRGPEECVVALAVMRKAVRGGGGGGGGRERARAREPTPAPRARTPPRACPRRWLWLRCERRGRHRPRGRGGPASVALRACSDPRRRAAWDPGPHCRGCWVLDAGR
jgi:hypothetical protein